MDDCSYTYGQQKFNVGEVLNGGTVPHGRRSGAPPPAVAAQPSPTFVSI